MMAIILQHGSLSNQHMYTLVLCVTYMSVKLWGEDQIIPDYAVGRQVQ